MKNRLIVLFLIFILVCQAGVVFATDSENDEALEEETEYATGLAFMTDEEWAAFNATLPRISEVYPNEIAISRVQDAVQPLSLDDDNVPDYEVAEIGNEMRYTYPNETGAGASGNVDFPLASAVDVSASLTFPPIGNQEDIGSCVSWSLVYYQLTNNNCVARGKNARDENGNMIEENVMSPTFTYVLTNGGRNGITYFDDAAASIMAYGSPTAAEYDYHMSNAGIRKWPTDKNIWENALYNKPATIAYDGFSIGNPVDGNNIALKKIKKILSNGYVVTIPTIANAFVYTRRTSTNEYAVRYVDLSSQDGHAMTIVGYDDNFWIDVNNNNVVDDGERGAFKLANSWGEGASNHNNGFIWVAYDAIGSESNLENMPEDRTYMFKDFYYIEPQKDYTPLLVAEVELTTRKRNQITVKLGVSDTNSNQPTMLLPLVTGGNNIAFNNMAASILETTLTQGLLDLNFSGHVGTENATFAFDLTPVIKSVYKNTGLAANSNLRFYVQLIDEVDNGYDITLGDVTLYEPMTGKTATCQNTAPLSAMNNAVTKTVDFSVTPLLGRNTTQEINIYFNGKIDESTLQNSIYIKHNEDVFYPETELYGDNRIIIYPPDFDIGYDTNTCYDIHIGTGLKTLGGNGFAEEKTVPFYILANY